MTPSADEHQPRPAEQVRRRLMMLAEGDEQLRQLVPSARVRAAIAEPGLSLGELMSVVFDGYRDRPALGRRAYELETDAVTGRTTKRYLSTFSTITYGELQDQVVGLAAGMRHGPDRPVAEGDFVCVLGFAGPSFLAAEFAIVRARAVAVPLQTNMPIEGLGDIVHETGPAVLIATAEYLDLAVALAEHTGRIPKIVVMDHEDGDDDDRERLAHARAALERSGTSTSLQTFESLLELGREHPWDPPPSRPEDADRMAALLYTSGSTGSPKGAIFTEALLERPWLETELPGPKVTIGYTPLNHTLGRNDAFKTLAQGGTIFFTHKSDMTTFFDDVRAIEPTHILFVPRIAELVYNHYRNTVLARMHADPDDEKVIEAKVRAEMRSTFLGGRLVTAGLGSAPTSSELQDFLRECFDISLTTGYGTTEAGSITRDDRIFREVISDYRLRDVAESGYLTTDLPYPRGELLIKSSTTVPGYFENPDASAALFTPDGYQVTGDIVEERGPDHVVWIDRRNNVLKLSQGEYVTVGRLETLYANNSAVVHQIYLYGNSQRSYLVAVVVPDPEVVTESLGCGARSEEVARLVHAELRKVAGDSNLAPYEIPREIVLENEPFSFENGLLSSVRKPLRPNLKCRYEKVLDELYLAAERRQRRELMSLARPGDASSVLDKIGLAFKAVLGLVDVDVSRQNSFRMLGGDSLSAVELSVVLEDAFGLDVPASMILGPSSSARELAAHVEQTVRSGGEGATFSSVHGDRAHVDARDLTLDKFFSPPPRPASPPARPEDVPATVLVTGANGYLGRFLSLEWLEHAARVNGKVICLVRADDAAGARSRLTAAFDSGSSALAARFAALAERHLEVVAADLTAPRLGLDPSVHDRLAGTVDLIVHAAALVNHTLAYRHLFEPNVVGTAELIRLALTGRPKRFDFISSVAAIRSTAGPEGSTEDADIRDLSPAKTISDAYASGYGVSKWAGEVLLREAHETFGLPVTVYRSDMILAHSVYDGQINASDTFSRLLLSVAMTGIAPASFYPSAGDGRRARYDGLPVDFTAAAMQQIGVQHCSGFRTFNVRNTHDHGVSLDRIVDWIESAGHRVERVPDHAEWLSRFAAGLEALPDQQRSQSSYPVLEAYRYPLTSPAQTDSRCFEAAIRGLPVGIEAPLLTEAFVHKCLRDLTRLGLG